jgi:hypothetical protein
MHDIIESSKGNKLVFSTFTNIKGYYTNIFIITFTEIFTRI